ncbi:restriction endonuclease subunit S [Vibrio sp. Vb2110]|uniref:restriction endonuclease subunit S n=1 Tax=unclassified Vibrio TaxID=2614977 RepID=UPI002963E201|nr:MULTISPECIES: restriction endonuclease subunit S [unclassified Vibrio]MDW1848065.1 restriction endonuclease subunit S [Vibrio sp. Vb2130]MDW1882183.1 restriction endonuclease subunit S [Vibrio sp. Vb2110]MDW2039658.1 restriction endonuclease subunit S [Vibrio sp. 2130-1]MDW2136671.1 restriction endonuclease subunit S [Vibrio sp. 2128(2023)]
MVPNGWKVLPLSEITKEKISYGIVQAGPHVEGGIPYIKSADVGGDIDVQKLQKTAPEIHHKYRRSAVHPNDIVFSLRGNIARTSIVPSDLPEANLTQGTARISVNDKNDTKFVYYKLASTSILNRINSLSKGSTFKEISLEELRKVKLPLPPLSEQRKIAKILSTWDKAISTTEKLIETSKQQKKALMQQLLTGKKRLVNPETGKAFEGEWKEVTVDDTCIVGRGRVISKIEISDNQGMYPVYSSQTLNNGIMGCIGTYDFEGEYVTWTTDGVNAGTVFFRSGKFNCTNVCGTLKPKDIKSLDTKYLALALSLETFKYVSHTLANPKLMNGVMKTVLFRMPLFSEQQKISSVLTAADKEIEILTAKLAHFKQEKKALMQQLLTGKRRVKIEEMEVA